ncbi:major facilitator superfamily domain-containing protein [Talaromyces proteolyticus]|uniref:Major facilitator superfamily domain-containing protein n=1 Tax=Talaromyces proteolyticus TaxID=1131652 RepID=A0AAD4KVE9_9EURO|nr:major facilitator superfamily domain-containing protein [Talaromyces proteolyticus]KAH8700696.1 major facilitator superfamily domain-containing protein [Talaromyces proteolyticus]
MSEKGETEVYLDSPTESGHQVDLKVCGDVILVPQPSDDVRDPLNWSQRKKYLILTILTLTTFSGHATGLANQLGFPAQAELYHKTLTEISYTISADVAGFAAGPLLIIPFTHVFGRCSVLLWATIASASFSIWSAVMTGPDDYIKFTISRLFVGIFGSTPFIIGPQLLVDIFFLHERGRVFNTFFVVSTLGTVVGPTLGGFIVAHAPWPWQFWWTIILEWLIMILVFVFVEETTFTRNNGRKYPPQPTNFFQNRIATYFPGTAVAHGGGLKEAARSAKNQFLIGLSPVTMLVGTYMIGMCGWFVAINTLLGVFIQGSVEDGGYGFDSQQSAAFSITLWVGLLVAQVWGYFVNDRIPLRFSKRASGVWKPEYRLHSLWVPSLIVMPIGLGMFGAALQYHLHYMVLATGAFLVTAASNAAVPVSLNYLVECFMSHPIELNCVTGLYRLGLGLGIPFFINAWVAKVGVGWVFGMMAFFTLAEFLLIVVLMLRGHELRQISFGKLNRDEEGVQVVK